MYVTPGVIVDGQAVTHNLVDINLGIRILLGHSFYDDWDGRRDLRQERPARQPGGSAPSLEPDDDSPTAESELRREIYLGHVAALVRQADERLPGPRHWRWPIARPWSTALAGLVDIGYVKATGQSVKIYLPRRQ